MPIPHGYAASHRSDAKDYSSLGTDLYATYTNHVRVGGSEDYPEYRHEKLRCKIVAFVTPYEGRVDAVLFHRGSGSLFSEYIGDLHDIS